MASLEIPSKAVFISFCLHFALACESSASYSGEPTKRQPSPDSITPAASPKDTMTKTQNPGANEETSTMRGTTKFNKFHMLIDFDLGNLNSLGGLSLTGTFAGICWAFDKPQENTASSMGPPLLKGPCPETLMVGEVKSKLWIACPAESFSDPRNPQVKIEPVSQNFIYDHMYVLKRNSNRVVEAKLSVTKDLLGGRSNLSVEDTCKELYKKMPGGAI
jgi:hypothetical protein